MTTPEAQEYLRTIADTAISNLGIFLKRKTITKFEWHFFFALLSAVRDESQEFLSPDKWDTADPEVDYTKKPSFEHLHALLVKLTPPSVAEHKDIETAFIILMNEYLLTFINVSNNKPEIKELKDVTNEKIIEDYCYMNMKPALATLLHEDLAKYAKGESMEEFLDRPFAAFIFYLINMTRDEKYNIELSYSDRNFLKTIFSERMQAQAGLFKDYLLAAKDVKNTTSDITNNGGMFASIVKIQKWWNS